MGLQLRMVEVVPIAAIQLSLVRMRTLADAVAVRDMAGRNTIYTAALTLKGSWHEEA